MARSVLRRLSSRRRPQALTSPTGGGQAIIAPPPAKPKESMTARPPADDSEETTPRTYMRRSDHLSIEPESLQRNWSLYRQRRHAASGRQTPPPNSRTVSWGNQVRVNCGACGKHIAKVVAFRVDDLCGLVDDATRWTLGKSARPAVTTGVGTKHPPPFWVEGSGYAAVAHFRCRNGHTRNQNAHKLAHEIWRNGPSQLPLSMD